MIMAMRSFIALNSQMLLSNRRDSTRQVKWIEEVLTQNTKKWIIVFMHHPVYSSGWGRDNRRLRTALKPIFQKYGVDLVLQGHDHTYARGGNNIPIGATTVDSTGPVYVVSVSGPKMYASGLYDWINRAGTNIQLYQVIQVKEDHIKFEAFTVLGDLYDAFTIKKNKYGINSFVDQAPKHVPENLEIPHVLLNDITPQQLELWTAQFENYMRKKRTQKPLKSN